MWSGRRWVEHTSHPKNFEKSIFYMFTFLSGQSRTPWLRAQTGRFLAMPQGSTTFSSTTARFFQINDVKRLWINHLSSKVMWEQAKITDDSNEPSGDCSAEKNIKAMDAYSKALQAGDMKSCLPVLVSLFCLSKMFLTPPRTLPTPSVASAKFQCRELIFIAFSRRSGNR